MQVHKHPDAVAVEYDGTSLTYLELNTRANQLAHALVQLGVRPNDIVGLCVERSLDLIIGILGILKSGAAYLPLDPEYPAERLAFMLAEASAPVLVTQRALSSQISFPNTITLYVDEQVAVNPSSNEFTGSPPIRSCSTDLAYVIFTSGSTGKPKGTLVTHHNVVRLFASTHHWFGFTAKDVWTLFHSFAFDFSVWEIWGALLYGGKLVIVPEAMRKSPGDFYRLLSHHRVTVLNQTPSVFRQLIHAEECAGQLPLSLRFVIFGGEALQIEMLRSWWERHGDETPQVVNMYGITETTVHVTYRPLCRADLGAGSVIGIPIPDLEVHLLDAEGKPVADGMAGEMYVAGAGLAKGYLQRPDLTAQRFVSDHISGQPNARLYRTGDLARKLPGGDLEYLGRIDQQVKIRGFRIELGEIESILERHAEIASSAVVAETDARGDQQLVAYLVIRDAATVTVQNLREWLGRSLPDYMMPARFVVVEALPLTPNGKVDRKALAACPGQDLVSGTEFVPPQTPLESQLAHIWQQVLRLERVSVEDNFFAMGGHSLLAQTIVAQIRTELVLEVPVIWIFRHPTVRSLAQKLAGDQVVKVGLDAIKLVDRTQPLPMSFGQQRMWLLQQTLPNPAAYNVPVAFHLQGEVQAELLARCLQQIQDRHEILRTALVHEEGELRQRIVAADVAPLPWTTVDWQSQSPAERESLLKAEITRPFDLIQLPLWRAMWAQTGRKESWIVLTFHHSIVDEWSLSLFCRELTRLCEAHGDIDEADLPTLDVQYADFAAWEQECLQERQAEPQREYWRQQLANLPTALELPRDFPRPLQLNGCGDVHRYCLPMEITTPLRQLAAETGTGLFTLMLAAYQVWLHRYTGQQDLVVGTPFAHRDRPEVQSVIGFFLNTLPIRVQLDPSQSFRAVLDQVRTTVLSGLEHSDLPFEQIVQLAGQGHAGGNQPLYQAMFVLLERGITPWNAEGITTTPIPCHTGTSKCDLTLNILAEEDSCNCELEFATDLFTADTARRMAEHWTELLRSIVQAPDQSVGSLNLLTSAERQQVLYDWNATEVDDPRDECIHQLFEEQVRHTPHATAITFRQCELSYQELAQHANQIAWGLKAHGVGPGVSVGICMERTPDMVAAILGVLKAGGAYVPLDPNYPSDRLAFTMQDCRAPVVIAHRSTASTCTWPAGTLCLSIEDWVLPANQADPPYNNTANDLAYVIYTSGSTGMPKGVAIEHRNTVSFLNWAKTAFTADELAGVLAATSICFDLSVFEIFGPLCWGGAIILAPNALEGERNPAWHKTTLINTVPSVMDSVLTSTVRPDSLLTVNLAGEPLKPSLVDAIYRNWQVQRVNDLYGPTETTTYSTWTTRHPGEPATIGRPLSNSRVYILDGSLLPLPIGGVGELYIGGDGVARGYLNRPELTAERFLPDPFRAEPAARMYRTGDLARWRADGQLEYLGRGDQQVKIRGFRIELGETESTLERHADVDSSAVVAETDARGDQQLVAYLVLRDAATVSVQTLREWLGRSLPEYMIPGRFVVLEALPLTPNGKVDRKALAACQARALVSGEKFKPPQTPLESQLASIWQKVLRLERVSVEDNFFAMGGHSLLAQTVIAEIRCECGLELPLTWVFQYPTIRGLAHRLADASTGEFKLDTIKPIDRTQPLPMSFGQQRMWILQQTLPNPAAYNVPIAFHLQGEVQGELLARCLRHVRDRHEILRTALVHEEGALRQRIVAADVAPLPWTTVDWQSQSPAERESLLKAEITRPFDMIQPPLWRALWAQTGRKESWIVLTFHHSIVDEWSLPLFCRELSQLYSAHGDIDEADLPTLDVQYADFAIWEQECLQERQAEPQREYWRQQLANLPTALELPCDFPRPRQLNGCGDVHRFCLPLEITAPLRRLAAETGTSLFALMLTTYQVWLHRYTGQQDLVVGTPFAHRDRPEVQSVIGFFLNTLPIRVQLDPNQSFRAVLDQVRSTVLSGLEHSDLPFEQIVQLAGQGHAGGNQPLYQAMFVLLERGITPWNAEGITTTPIPCHTGTSKCDLTLSILAEEGSWNCELEFATDLFTADTARRMAEHWTELLRSIVQAPDQSVGSMNLLTSAERQQVLYDWNATAVDYPRDQCIHQLFEEQVRRTPQAVAVTFAQDTLTYGELNHRANRLAHRLNQLGVSSDTTVGICLDRSLDMLVAMLGVLKAGGAYIPLDPKYPPERLKFILSDSQTRWVLTEQHSLFEELQGQLTCVSMTETAGNWPSDDLNLQVSSRQLAYVMYTSGSTGQPKGVGIEHRSVVNFVTGMLCEPGLSATDCLLAATSINFDISVLETLLPLMVGARVVIASEADRHDAASIVSLIRNHSISVVQGTPAFWRLLWADDNAGELPVKALCGGEAMPTELARQLTTRCAEAWNMYGPTETTIWSTVASVELGASISIGKPIANTQVYVLNPNGELQTPGTVGELYIGGDGVARGYLNRPELTAERFLPDPFRDEPNARMYRTGDLARWRADGQLEYLGRGDQQVKIRGFRIELGEIESTLERHADVDSSAVVAETDARGDQQLVAYLVLRDAATVSVQTLREWLGRSLPEYMIPARFVVLEALPLTPNGKVDRKALAACTHTTLSRASSYIEPSNELEQKLAVVWQEVLNNQTIGVHDDFFEFGGHSLLSLQLVAEVQKKLGYSVPTAAVLNYRTISQMATLISSNSMKDSVSSKLLTLQPLGDKPPLVFMPSLGGTPRFWSEIMEHWEPDRPVYSLGLANEAIRWPDTLSLEEIAAGYLDGFQSIDPATPVHLTGYSFGGTLAAELARQLKQSGRRIGTVLAIDAWPGLLPSNMSDSRIQCIGWFLENLPFWIFDKAFRSSWSELILAIKRKWHSVVRGKRPSAENVLSVEDVVDTTGMPDLYVQRMQIAYEALQRYAARPYAGDVVVIRARTSPLFDSLRPDLGWNKIAAGRVRVVRVPGNHSTMLNRQFASKLTRCIRQSIVDVC
jgi:amino acid adenylation domain-containing protein